MYEIIKNVIESKAYELVDMLKKINTVWIESNITDEQKQELDELARTNAKAENSYAPLQKQLENTNLRIDSLEERIAKLEGQATEEPTEPEPVDEYSEFKQPSGAHDAYHVGDKITYNGKKYICKLDNCVWTPDAYPQGWQEVVEENTEESEVDK